jgi:signal transduction histidine kinase
VLSRSWLGALGLRGRIAGAVFVTAATTLLVAAIVLLPRLETSLRNSAQVTLSQNLTGTIQRFRRLKLTYLPQGLPGSPGYELARSELHQIALRESSLEHQVGAQSVIMVGYIDSSGRGSPLLAQDRAQQGSIDTIAVATAWLSGTTVPGITAIGGTQYAFEAIPIGERSDAVLWVTKPINEIPGAVDTVRIAFLFAALAALLLTFLLAIPLSATLVRRLQRLRVAALQLAADGAVAEVPSNSAVAEMPIDRTRDEVGDLARTFALMQRRLQHQEAARRAFVATASHELRTPLASLDAMLELLAEDLKGGDVDIDDAQVLLERARLQTKRLSRLAADLLDLSRIDAGVQLRSEAVELGELSRAVLAEFELGAQERGVGLALHEPDTPVWALGDPGSVARILRILIDNALRLAPAGTEIEVELEPQQRPSLSVIDHGPGVPDDEREMIFERFQRGRTTGGEAGFGLGLAIGRELAERMGGELLLAPASSRGATFTLTLPVATAPVEDPVASAARP